MKFCKDCKNIIPDAQGNLSADSRCKVIFMEANPVTGEQPNGFCENARRVTGNCGPDAKLFEERT